MALNLGDVREALRAQIHDYLDLAINVYAYRTAWVLPAVTFEPVDPFISVYETFGPNGLSDIELNVCVNVSNENPDEAESTIDRYLSIGQGNGSSVIDAIHADITLGGLVESCRCLTVSAPTPSMYGFTARCHVQIILRKAGAN